MSQGNYSITLNGTDGNDAIITPSNNVLLFSGMSRYDFDNDVYAKNVKLANETDIQNLQNEINTLPLAAYGYINADQETSLLGGIPYGTGGVNTLIQSPDLIYDSVNKLVKVDNINLATQTQIDVLQSEIDAITPNPNAWINSNGITSTNNQILFTNGISNSTITDPSFTYTNISNPTLTIGAAQIISENNNMKLESADYILTTKDIYLQGTEDVQRYLTVGCTNQNDNVKTYVDINTADYICDNQLLTKTEWKNASGYYFDNNIYQSDILIPQRSEIDYLQGEINTNSNDISGLNSSVLGLSQRTDALETTTATQQIAIDGLGVSVNTNTSDISSLGVLINSNTSSINTLGITVNSQGSTINDLGVAVNALNSTTISQQSQINTNTSNISTINGKLKQNLYNYYVSNTSGNDTTGSGNLNNPYKTIGAVMTVINALSADINVVINLSAGNYTENVSVIKSGVSIIGANSISTIITGDILFNMVQNNTY